MKRITLIVTVYNRLEYVRNIIICLLNQTKMIDELIFADDGSSENLQNEIKDLIPLCKFKIKHVYQKDLGFRLSRSRNNGVRNAEGKYLIFLDQDVILPDNFIEKIYKNRQRKTIVYTRALDSNENERNEIQEKLISLKGYTSLYNNIALKKKKEIKKAILKDKFYSLLYFLHLRSRGSKMAGLMFSLYKEDFLAINGFDEQYKAYGYEDDDFCNRFFKYGGQTRSINLDEFPIHMYHYFDNTKKYNLNEEYYYKQKKIISSKNYKCKYGFFNTIDSDEITVKFLN